MKTVILCTQFLTNFYDIWDISVAFFLSHSKTYIKFFINHEYICPLLSQSRLQQTVSMDTGTK